MIKKSKLYVLLCYIAHVVEHTEVRNICSN